MEITNDIKYIGVNDCDITLFEGQYEVKNGMSYNSYVILDEKTAVLDTVEAKFTKEWLQKVKEILGDNKPDYLVIHHMEPDHSAGIYDFLKEYKKAKVVASDKALVMINQFFDTDLTDRVIVVKEGDKLSLGKHNLTFFVAPMVHWPEVLVSYDEQSKILFSADAFGKFGKIGSDEEWTDEARRYYIGIVGKYGAQVQSLLKKLSGASVEKICPLHGPVLCENLGYYLKLYDTWSKYDKEKDGVVIAYTSIYGNTEKAVMLLADKLKQKGCPNVVVHNLAKFDMSDVISDAFCYDKLVLATTTYNMGIFPFMRTYIEHLTERNFQNRTVGIIENGTWAPMAVSKIKNMFEKSKNIIFAENNVSIKSALSDESRAQIDKLAEELCKSYK